MPGSGIALCEVAVRFEPLEPTRGGAAINVVRLGKRRGDRSVTELSSLAHLLGKDPEELVVESATPAPLASRAPYGAFGERL